MNGIRKELELYKIKRNFVKTEISRDEFEEARRKFDTETFETLYSEKWDSDIDREVYYRHDKPKEDVSNEELDLYIKLENLEVQLDIAKSLQVVKIAAYLFIFITLMSILFFLMSL